MSIATLQESQFTIVAKAFIRLSTVANYDCRVVNYDRSKSLYKIVHCGQSYKASTIVVYESRVVNISNLRVITTVESYFTIVAEPL